MAAGIIEDKAPAHELAALARLVDAVDEFQPAAFSSSFGLEDMVILDLLARHRLPAEVFTLDTGRLHEENARADRGGATPLPVADTHPVSAGRVARNAGAA